MPLLTTIIKLLLGLQKYYVTALKQIQFWTFVANLIFLLIKMTKIQRNIVWKTFKSDFQYIGNTALFEIFKMQKRGNYLNHTIHKREIVLKFRWAADKWAFVSKLNVTITLLVLSLVVWEITIKRTRQSWLKT